MRREKPEYSWDVFVSYSHKDTDIVRPVTKQLQEFFARDRVIFYLDAADEPQKHQHGLEMGISEGLATCQLMLVFLSKNYTDSSWCMSELKNFIILRKLESDRLKSFNTNIPPLSMEQIIFPIVIEARDRYELIRNFSRLNFLLPAEFDFRMELLFKRIYWLTPQKEEAFFSSLTKNLKKSFDHIIEYHKSLRETGIFPHLDTPKKVWDIFWAEYPYTKIGSDINIERILNSYCPQIDVSKFNNDIDNYSKNSLLLLFKGIAADAPITRSFDLQKAREIKATTKVIGSLSSKLFDKCPELYMFSQIGPPVPVLIANIKSRCLTSELQSSYYRYLDVAGRHILVDTAVMASLLMSLDIWQVLVTTEKDFLEYVVGPLATGGNISGMY